MYVRDDTPLEIPLPAPRTADTFTLPAIEGDPVYLVLHAADGTPWLVASRAAWHWN